MCLFCHMEIICIFEYNLKKTIFNMKRIYKDYIIEKRLSTGYEKIYFVYDKQGNFYNIQDFKLKSLKSKIDSYLAQNGILEISKSKDFSVPIINY